MGQIYRRMEDQNLGPRLAHNQDFAKGEGPEPKVTKLYCHSN